VYQVTLELTHDSASSQFNQYLQDSYIVKSTVCYIAWLLRVFIRHDTAL